MDATAAGAATAEDQQLLQDGIILVNVLSTVLDRLCVANVAVARADPGQITKFHAMKAPGIGILQYLERIHKYASCSNECFVLALIYIDRLIQRNNFLLTELNVHRVVITSILLAAKFFDDAYYNNAYYAKVGGVLVSEMNGLEVDFLFRINFSLHVTPEVYEKYRAELLLQAIAPGAIAPLPHHQEFKPSTQRPTTNNYTQCSYVSVETEQDQESSPMVGGDANSTTSPPRVCNPQAPASHGFTEMATSAQQIPFVHAKNALEASQITPSPESSQNAIVQTTVYDTQSSAMLHPGYFPGGQITHSQKAHSYPAIGHPVHSKCGPCSSYSAPAVITPGMHYPAPALPTMVDHQIFPLQNILVHHHHGVGRNMSNSYSIPAKLDSRGQIISRGVL